MALVGSAKKIAVRTIVCRVPHNFVELCEEVNGIDRHLNVDWGCKLRSHATHALAGGSFALMCFAFDYENFCAAGCAQMIGDARPDDPAPDDYHVRCFDHFLDAFRRSVKGSYKNS